MRRDRGFFLLWVRAGMELCWICAWANMLTLLILQRSFPFADAVGIFMFAAALARLSTGRGWRIIGVLGIQSLGMALSGLRILFLFESSSHSFLNWRWVTESFTASRTPLEWLILFYLLLWALLLWIGGFRFARRPSMYLNVCSRFDLGLGAFFLLFLTKMTLSVKGGMNLNESVSETLALSFFLFGLLAIGWVRDRGEERKDFLPGYQGIGMIFIFTGVVIVFGTGLVLFFSPYLNVAAETGYSGLRIAARPIGSIFVAVMRFLYFRNIDRPEEPSASGNGGFGDLTLPVGGSEGTGIWEKVLGLGLFGLIGLASLAMAGYAAYCLIRWLLSRTGKYEKGVRRRTSFSEWIRGVRNFFLSLWNSIIRPGERPKGSVFFLGRLLRWGRRSGLPHQVQQTPAEYGSLLMQRFPGLKKEIEQIVEVFDREIYGGLVPGEEEMAISRTAWKRLRNPRHWPVRIRHWFPRRGGRNTE